MKEFKPNKKVFLIFRFLRGSLVNLFVFIILWLISSQFIRRLTDFKYTWAIFLIIYLLVRVISLINLYVRYKKETYIFMEDKIINKTGSIFSDYETELNIKNITNVSMILPFIEYWRFKTGHIKIQSAGSGTTEIDMLSLEKTDKIYNQIKELMELNGFSLDKKELIQQETPHIIGVIFESMKRFVATLAGLGFIILNMTGLTVVFFNKFFILATLGLAFVLLGVFIWSILVFFDLKNRIYRVYSELITYNEGFLTKRYAFIPLENLADSSINQTLVDRLFNLYDVKISSQGAGQEITFKNMLNGKLLQKNLDKLIAKTDSLIKKKSKEEKTVTKKLPNENKLKETNLTSYTANFQMDMMRSLFPVFVLMVILFPLIPILIFTLIPIIIQVTATKFIVKKNSMEEYFSFISTKSKEFTNDKITAIVFRESIIDKIFETFTINFWSIGSSQDINFKNIKKAPDIVKSIISKSGITQAQNQIYKLDSSFSLKRMFKAVLPLTIILTVLLITVLILSIYLKHIIPFLIFLTIAIILMILTIIYKKRFYRNSKLTFYKDYIHFSKGILIKTDYYMLYENVKDIKTIRYPFSKTGSIIFNIAGEHMQGQGNQQVPVSNNFRINYIEDISSKDELIDLIFHKGPESKKIKEIENNIDKYKPEIINQYKPSLKNPLFVMITTSVIIFPLLILIPVTIPLIILKTKAITYRIEDYRVVAKSGVIYKKQVSIVFDKIDYINTSQNFLNKMFKNGNVTINTAGSSQPELIISNIPDFKGFYKTLNSHY
ncbi:MAG: PH domain-containing protein [Nanobdellota archaeon]